MPITWKGTTSRKLVWSGTSILTPIGSFPYSIPARKQPQKSEPDHDFWWRLPKKRIIIPFSPIIYTPNYWFDSSTESTGALSSMHDRSGNGNDAPLTGGQTAGVIGTEKGMPCLLCDGIAGVNMYSLPAGFSVDAQNFTWFIAGFVGDNYLDHAYLVAGSLNPALAPSLAEGTVNTGRVFGLSPNQDSTIPASVGDEVYSFSSNASASMLSRGGYRNMTQAACSPGTSTGGYLGQYSNTYFFTGGIREVLCFPHLSSTAYNMVLAYLQTRWGSPTVAAPRQMSFFGDSITANYRVVGCQGFPRQLQQYLGNSWAVYNYGISGMTASGASPYVAGGVHLRYDAGLTDNWCYLGVGTNDLGNGNPPATVYTNLMALVTQVAGYGYAANRILVPTVISRGTGISEPDRVTLNNSINGGSGGSYVAVNYNTQPLIGAFGASSNLIYFQSDGIHTTAAGDTLMFDVIKTTMGV